MRSLRGRLIRVVAVLGIVLMVGGAYLLGASSGAKQAAASRAPLDSDDASLVLGPGPMYELKERVVNLADANGRRYLKIGLAIEFSTGGAEFRKAGPEARKAKQAEFEKDLAPQAPLIEDSIITILSVRTSSELSTPEGKQKLKTDIKQSLNELLGGDRVSNVYFTQFVMQ